MNIKDDVDLELTRRLELARQQEAEANELDDDATDITNIEERKKKNVRDVQIDLFKNEIKKLRTQIEQSDARIGELLGKITEAKKIYCQKCGLRFDKNRGLLLCEECLCQKLLTDFRGAVNSE